MWDGWLYDSDIRFFLEVVKRALLLNGEMNGANVVVVKFRKMLMDMSFEVGDSSHNTYNKASVKVQPCCLLKFFSW